MNEKIALFHPWIKSRGGAEKTILEILKSKKDIEVYTWIYEKNKTFEEFSNFKINVIGINFLKKFSRFTLLRGFFLLNCLFSKIPLKKYNKFFISSSGLGEFIVFRNYLPKKTYLYIHTPLREATKEIIEWNLKNRYKKFPLKNIYLCAVKFYSFIEKLAWKKTEFVVFNSELSLERAKSKNLIKNQKTQVIYPPIEINSFNKIKIKKGNYFLYPSRINPPKRQELLIKAWEKFEKKYPNEKLVIAGSKENEKYYQKLKILSENCKNLQIKTDLENKEFKKLYSESKAIIFLGLLEDFGIVPFEALSLGKPLIAVDKGGYFELIKKFPQYFKIKEKFDEKKMIKEINNSLANFMKSKISPKKIRKFPFSEDNFINKITCLLEQ